MRNRLLGSQLSTSFVSYRGSGREKAQYALPLDMKFINRATSGLLEMLPKQAQSRYRRCEECFFIHSLAYYVVPYGRLRGGTLCASTLQFSYTNETVSTILSRACRRMQRISEVRLVRRRSRRINRRWEHLNQRARKRYKGFRMRRVRGPRRLQICRDLFFSSRDVIVVQRAVEVRERSHSCFDIFSVKDR